MSSENHWQQHWEIGDVEEKGIRIEGNFGLHSIPEYTCHEGGITAKCLGERLNGWRK